MNFPALLVLLGLALATANARGATDPIRQALLEIEQGGSLAPDQRRALQSHPLFRYLEYAELQRDMAQLSRADIEAFAGRYPDHPLLPRLREAWLLERARRGDHAGVLQAADAARTLESRCHVAHARLRLQPGEDAWREALALWQTGQSAPAACDAVFALLAASGRLGTAERWERFELAIEAGNPSLAAYLGRGLPAKQRALAEDYAAFVGNGGGDPASWPATARSARVLAAGLDRLARRDPDRAETLLRAHADLLRRQAGAEGRVRHALALWSATSYLPATAARMARVPAEAFDDTLHEWRVREALAREDWQAAHAAVQAMPEHLRQQPRWRYFGARIAELLGDTESAQQEYRALAGESHYHGFLAADRIGAPYALCPRELPRDAGLRQRVENDPGIVRALALKAIDRPGWASAEWTAAVSRLRAVERRFAAELATERGWPQRAVADLSGSAHRRYYRLRFPLSHRKELVAEATRRGLDPAWVAALIRAESAWDPGAVSVAGARGLMQLMPDTGRSMAQALGLRWRGVRDLHEPLIALQLGSEYLARQLRREDGVPLLATAAYNAGPAPVGRWRSQRPLREPDLWIETIPYRETREYVAQVMAFSVIYDWRLAQDAYPLSLRLRAQPDDRAPRRGFACAPSHPPVRKTP
ncbi:MAG: murein transglycosylase [Lysobacteraceae bacterium]|nr:MAG: murein transglycosylase [Xanthomonadaceae bacterium]